MNNIIEEKLPENAAPKELASPKPPKQRSRPGKASSKQRQETYRARKNQEYEDTELKARFADWMKLWPVDDLLDKSVLTEVSSHPPVTVPVSFDAAIDVVSTTAYEISKLIKDNDVKTIEKTLFSGLALQLEAKLWFRLG